jgi:hypothetical protein
MQFLYVNNEGTRAEPSLVCPLHPMHSVAPTRSQQMDWQIDVTSQLTVLDIVHSYLKLAGPTSGDHRASVTS